MQNAAECQDPVTTRQDQGQTCWDVFVEVKPSLVCPVATTRCDKSLSALALRGAGAIHWKVGQGGKIVGVRPADS